MTGSRRVSVNEEPPLLPGGLPPAMKLLTAAFLLYSSSTSRLLLFRMKRYTPPEIAATATIPTTTPAAMPALLGPVALDPVDDALGEPVAVTTMVCPPTVTTDGLALVVDEGTEAEELVDAVSAMGTLLVRPDK